MCCEALTLLFPMKSYRLKEKYILFASDIHLLQFYAILSQWLV